MPKDQTKRPKNLIGLIILIIVVLVAVGGAIYYYINYSLNFTPEVEDVASVPCRCKWVSEDDDTKVIAEASGYLQNSSCQFPQSYEIGGTEVSQCSDITELDELETLVATQESGTLGPGVISMSSDPVVPPAILTEDNQTVTFTIDFALYALEQNLIYNTAKMEITYPDVDNSPEPTEAQLTEENTTTYTYLENGQTVTGYRVTFLSTWNEVTNYGEEGLYKVAFTAKDSDDVWTDASTGTLQYYVGDAATGEYFCNNIDIVQTRTTESANVTATAVANLPEGHEATYTWEMDRNCSGDIDEGETFSTTTNTITKEFTYPDNKNEELQCEVSVTIELDDSTDIDSRSEESCLGYVTMKPQSELCGDGVLDEAEECDPAIEEGDEDYIANCQDDCTVLVTDEEDPEEEESDDTESTDQEESEDTISTEITVGQTCPSCVSLSGEDPTADIIITVTNSAETAQTVRAVSNSLPQGFTFSEGSSSVNEIDNATDEGILVEVSGDSQLITWDNDDNGWTVTGNGGTLVIEFTAEISPSTDEGTYTNTVTVTPADTDPIQSDQGVVLAQSCEQPETALFDRSLYPIIVGSVLLVMASLAYYTGFGTKRFETVVGALEDIGLLISKPQKHMERRIERKARRERDKKD
jgi:hypothetical protein